MRSLCLAIYVLLAACCEAASQVAVIVPTVLAASATGIPVARDDRAWLGRMLACGDPAMLIGRLRRQSG